MAVAERHYDTRAPQRTFPARDPLPRYAPAPPELQPRAASSRHRHQEQNSWLTLILAASLTAGLSGIFYVSSYTSLAREAYRRVELRQQLQTEMEKHTRFQQSKAKIDTPEYIKMRARQLGLVPAQHGDGFTVGKARQGSNPDDSTGQRARY